jgi:uncharacterized protein (TIGR03118 family)
MAGFNQPNVGTAVAESLEPRVLLAHSVSGLQQTNLVSNRAGIAAAHVDPLLENPWGIANAPGGPFWVTDNGTGKSTLYDGAGVKDSLTITITGAGGVAAAPTGEVFNGGSGFAVSQGGKSGPAEYLFVGEDGGISGWNQQVNADHTVIAVDHSAEEAIYKGVTIGSWQRKRYLYAADFHNGDIEVYDDKFVKQSWRGAFGDSKLPAGYGPFNVQAIGNRIYVTFAKKDAAGEDEVAGAGLGRVDVFDGGGHLLMRFKKGKFMDAPWAVTQAPANWGKFGGDILVGQFGNGTIAAFKAKNGKFHGLLHGTDGKPVSIEGLWALTFGNGAANADPRKLYFTAGPNDEADGLFGSLALVARKKSTSGGTGGTVGAGGGMYQAWGRLAVP